MSSFKQQKSRSLSKVDLSRKGSVDEAIVTLVDYINQQDEYFTTSSCSGRIYLYEENSESRTRKKGCRWLYTTHGLCNPESMIGALENASGDAMIKFEPFVLHVQCRSLPDAQALHAVSIGAGFRNSGISVGKSGKIITAVRSTHTLEAPLTRRGKMIVTDQYVNYVAEIANNKMEENLRRIERFFNELRKTLNENEHCTSKPDVYNNGHATDGLTVNGTQTSQHHLRRIKQDTNSSSVPRDVTSRNNIKDSKASLSKTTDVTSVTDVSDYLEACTFFDEE